MWDRRCSPRYSPSLEMAFQIAHVFDAPLDEVFRYPDAEASSV
jgi:putative transcriptional regulator